jgi:hypothetical protein
MPFLPSLLEYTPQDLESKLVLIKKTPIEFQTIQKAVDEKIHLHLDFVLPEFAAQRNVLPGNGPKVVFDLISKYFHDKQVVCNSHFMGSAKDTAEVLEFFQSYSWNPNWEYILYVGPEFVVNFNLFKNSNTRDRHLVQSERSYLVGENTPNKTRLKIGAWLDLDQYNTETSFELKDYLLMTVFAGKSGQKLTPEVRSNCLKVVEDNPYIKFTIDGGWAVLDELSELNTDQKNKLNVVSYSSFWKELEKRIIALQKL